MCPQFWAGIFWDHTSFKEAKLSFDNKVTALTYVHLAQFCIAPVQGCISVKQK